MPDDLKELLRAALDRDMPERPQRDVVAVVRHGRHKRALIWVTSLLAVVLLVAAAVPLARYVANNSSAIEPTREGDKADNGEADVPALPPRVPITGLENGRIAYSLSTGSGVELHSIKPDGSGDRVIPVPLGEPWQPSWSPDGSKLAISMFPAGEADRTIWVMNSDGSDAQQVAAADNVSRPSWSADGKTIVYSASTSGQTEIHLVATDGSEDRTVHSEDAAGTFAIFSADVSPDGQMILFDRGTDAGFDIFVMNVDGSDARPLTTTGTDYNPDWSPDGTKIAFTRQEAPATSNIFVMNADGTKVQRLTDGGSDATYQDPHWAPDGSKMAYEAGVTGGPGGLVVMNPDGSDPVTLVDDGVLGLSWQPVPPGRKKSP
jgi:WD40-like Beta Propeller Repeat